MVMGCAEACHDEFTFLGINKLFANDGLNTAKNASDLFESEGRGQLLLLTRCGRVFGQIKRLVAHLVWCQRQTIAQNKLNRGHVMVASASGCGQ